MKTHQKPARFNCNFKYEDNYNYNNQKRVNGPFVSTKRKGKGPFV